VVDIENVAADTEANASEGILMRSGRLERCWWRRSAMACGIAV